MLDTFSIRFIKHSEISDSLIDKIIALKQQHWPYLYKSQIDWININLADLDYHLLIIDFCGNIMAYMNLVNRKVNGIPIIGVGNVCIDKTVSEMGMGTLLMHVCKYYSKQLSLDLILLCKKELVYFYEKCGFHKYQNKVYVDGIKIENYVMFSNDNYASEVEIHINQSF